MMLAAAYLKNEEKIIFSLRGLYERYGYSRYKMSKFEEYDLYARNKEFLVSDNVITFTDTDGKLMALKPDVTLSIIHNVRDLGDEVRKLYYDENVYRVSKGNHAFKELMQTGLECFGTIDSYCISEVVMLAAKSLQMISPESILDISHLGILAEMIDALQISESYRDQILRFVEEKNLHELGDLCKKAGADPEASKRLWQLLSLSGPVDQVLPVLKGLEIRKELLAELERVLEGLYLYGLKDMIHIDFSVISDMNYYNGIVFKGFINGIPSSVLTGGQYGKLMTRMGKKAGAIGFAVYLDQLERLADQSRKFDVDLVLQYDDTTDPLILQQVVKELVNEGSGVLAVRKVPEKLRYLRLARLEGNEVKYVENHA